MASNASSINFLTIPREIRNLIYAYFTTKNLIYTITSANVAAIGDASEPNLSLINTCTTTQHEMLEMLCRHNTLRFVFPSSGTNAQSLCHKLGALMTRVEFLIDFSSFPWQSFRVGHLDPAARYISEQVCETLRNWYNQPFKRESCQIYFDDNARFVAPLLQLQIFEVLQTFVGLETLLVIMLQDKPDLRRLGASLRVSLGPSWIHRKWPVLPDAESHYGFVRFHPRKFLEEGTGGKGDVLTKPGLSE